MVIWGYERPNFLGIFRFWQKTCRKISPIHSFYSLSRSLFFLSILQSLSFTKLSQFSPILSISQSYFSVCVNKLCVTIFSLCVRCDEEKGKMVYVCYMFSLMEIVCVVWVMDGCHKMRTEIECIFSECMVACVCALWRRKEKWSMRYVEKTVVVCMLCFQWKIKIKIHVLYYCYVYMYELWLGWVGGMR